MTTRTITVEALAAALPEAIMETLTAMAGWGRAEIAELMWAALPPEPAGAGLREALERTLRPFIEGAAQWSSDPEISREAQRILNWLDDPEHAALAATPEEEHG